MKQGFKTDELWRPELGDEPISRKPPSRPKRSNKYYRGLGASLTKMLVIKFPDEFSGLPHEIADGVSVKLGLPIAKSWQFRCSMLQEYLEANGVPVKAQQKRSMLSKGKKGFYQSAEWYELRYQAFLKNGRKCGLCGNITGPFHVGHIKPRSKFPALALTLNNLHILCAPCNLGKGAWDDTDWRK